MDPVGSPHLVNPRQDLTRVTLGGAVHRQSNHRQPLGDETVSAGDRLGYHIGACNLAAYALVASAIPAIAAFLRS